MNSTEALGPNLFTSLPYEMFQEIATGNLTLKERAVLSMVQSVFRTYVNKLNSAEIRLDFDIENNIYSHPDRVQSLLTTFPNLRYIYLSSEKSREFRRPAEPSLTNPQTKILSIRHNVITDVQFKSLHPFFPQFSELDITWCDKTMTDETFRMLPTAFPNLRLLSMHACHAVSRDVFIATIPNMKNLESLDLSWNPQIANEDGFSRIAPILTKLKSLRLDYNEELPRAHFLSGIQHLVHLENLSIDSCLQFDDDTLLTMVEHLPKLMELNLCRVEFLTDNALMSISSSIPQAVIYLNKSGYPRIDQSKFSAMPQIKFV